LPATSGTFLTTTGGVAPGTSGNVLTSNGTTWTSAALPAGGVTSLNGQTGAITNTDYGAIGSYVIAAEDVFTASAERSINGTVAGSALIRDNTGAAASAKPFNTTAGTGVGTTNTSLSLSGTWRRMTRGINNTGGTSSSVNLYVRIS
jgi:hypothetical protein